MPDRDENTVDGHYFQRTILNRFDPNPGHSGIITQDFVNRRIVHDLDLAFFNPFQQARHQNRFCLERIATMDQGHFGRDVGKINCFIYCSIATADDGHFLIAIEKTVTGSTSGNPSSDESLFGFQPQILGGSASRDNQRVTSVLAHIADQPDRFFRQFGCMDMVEHNAGIETFSVFQHTLHQFGTGNARRVSRPVFHVGSRHQLTALCKSGHKKRFQVGPRRINGSGVTGRAGTQNQNIGMHWRSRHNKTVEND